MPVLTRTASEALAWCLSESLHPTRSFDGLCLRAVRTALHVPPHYASARLAWEATAARDRHRALAPPGVPVFWDVGRYGHVALSAGAGLCWSTDILRSGRVDVVAIALIERKWGARYLGWANRLNEVEVPKR